MVGSGDWQPIIAREMRRPKIEVTSTEIEKDMNTLADRTKKADNSKNRQKRNDAFQEAQDSNLTSFPSLAAEE